ncbi:unnamed protein product [Sympodiomycopsis kandeliae]
MHVSNFTQYLMLSLCSWSAIAKGRPGDDSLNESHLRRGLFKSLKTAVTSCCRSPAPEYSTTSSFESQHGPPMIIGSPHPITVSSNSGPSSPLGSSRKSFTSSSSSGPSKWNPLIPSTSPSEQASPPALKTSHRPLKIHDGKVATSKGKGKSIPIPASSSSSSSSSPDLKYSSHDAGPSGAKR